MDIVGILADQTADLIFLQVLTVVFSVGICFQMEHHICARIGFLRLFHSVAVGAGRFPCVRIRSVLHPGCDGDLVCDHEGGIEADAELSDDVGDILFFRLTGTFF